MTLTPERQPTAPRRSRGRGYGDNVTETLPADVAGVLEAVLGRDDPVHNALRWQVHSGLSRVLELDKEDLGFPQSCEISVPDLIAELLQPVSARKRDTMVETATKNRSSRPDVTVIGDGGLSLGCEAQFYNASPSTVHRRSKAHFDGGLVPNWITHNDTFHLVDRAPWMLTRDVTWQEINNAADLPLVGGYRVLANWHCTAAAERPCPTGNAKTGCGKRHLQWDTPRRLDSEGTGWTGYRGDRLGVTVGRTLIGTATGAVVPLFTPSREKRRSGSFMWVPADDRDTWAGHREVQTPTEEPEPEPDEGLHFSGRDADATCQFGDETWRPSAPLPRRSIASVELLITVDEPALPAIPQQPDGTMEHRAPTCRPSPTEPSAQGLTAPPLSIPMQPAAPTTVPAKPTAPRTATPAPPLCAPAPGAALTTPADGHRIPRQLGLDTGASQNDPNSHTQANAAAAEPDFPGDLLAAQTRLHQAAAELSALLRSLPWSVEPMKGWPGSKHPHTGEIIGGREPSPGWSDEQKEAVDRLLQECRELSATVTTHQYWELFQGADVIKERMRLKSEARPRASVTAVGLNTAV